MGVALMSGPLPTSPGAPPSNVPRQPYPTPEHQVTKARYITSNDPRGYIPVYEYFLANQWIMMDTDDGYVLWTSIWKALGNAKADIVRMTESQPELTSQIRRVRGGYLKIQGTWLPYEVALRLSRRVAWPIRHDLVPLFGPKFPETCLSPDQPGFGEVFPSARRRRPRKLSSTYAQPPAPAGVGSRPALVAHVPPKLPSIPQIFSEAPPLRTVSRRSPPSLAPVPSAFDASPPGPSFSSAGAGASQVYPPNLLENRDVAIPARKERLIRYAPYPTYASTRTPGGRSPTTPTYPQSGPSSISAVGIRRGSIASLLDGSDDIPSLPPLRSPHRFSSRDGFTLPPISALADPRDVNPSDSTAVLRRLSVIDDHERSAPIPLRQASILPSDRRHSLGVMPSYETLGQFPAYPQLASSSSISSYSPSYQFPPPANHQERHLEDSRRSTEPRSPVTSTGPVEPRSAQQSPPSSAYASLQ